MLIVLRDKTKLINIITYLIICYIRLISYDYITSYMITLLQYLNFL